MSYARINASLWISSTKWRKLLGDDRTRLLYLYLHTCPHRTGAGCYVLPLAYAASDLGWSEADVRKGIDTLSIGYPGGLIGYSEAESVVWIVGSIKNDPPTNWKHAAGLLSKLFDVPDCECKWLCLQQLMKDKQIRLALEKITELAEKHDTLSIAYRYPIDSLSSDPDPDPDPIKALLCDAGTTPQTPASDDEHTPDEAPSEAPPPDPPKAGSNGHPRPPAARPRKPVYDDTNPWHQDIIGLCQWFYQQDGRYQPKPAQKPAICEEVRKILDLDMEDTPRLQRVERLRDVLEAVVEDDFWSRQVLSLAGLRKTKSAGAPHKWQVAEAHLDRSTNGELERLRRDVEGTTV
uniref:Uncharacterized protein n=1 Tax=viral metagenome TaxID=1070528 RepID=A0A6M3J0R0_9ZZZZ